MVSIRTSRISAARLSSYPDPNWSIYVGAPGHIRSDGPSGINLKISNAIAAPFDYLF